MQDNITQPEQVYDPGNPATWPPELDAVVAAPRQHNVLFENDHVRVTDILVLPSEREPVHHHRWPSVLYIEKREAFRGYDAADNVTVDSSGMAPMSYPMTIWMEPQPLHSIENTSTTEPIHIIRVELKH